VEFTVFPPTATNTVHLPTEVISKYDVELVTAEDTITQVIRKKINDETVEKEEAFFIIDLGKILRKFKEWVELLPRVKPFYAIKCNPNAAIIKSLASLGANFDCASKNEIQQILGSGISSSRIIYANPTKMKSHITYAKSCGVDLMTFDNTYELEKIAECYPEARLVLRIITDDSQSVCKFSSKFGAPLDMVESILCKARELQLNVVGVSFHVGSGCMSVASFIAAIRSAHKVFKQAEEFGFTFTILDIGGGFPGTNTDGICFSEIANTIRPVLDSLFPYNVDIMAEPGRYFVADSHILVTNVFAKRMMTTESGEKKFLYYINDGVYQSFNSIFFDHAAPVPLLLEKKENHDDLHKCTLFGPTCDSMDCIAKDISLPELEVGDWLYFENMGAYTTAAASSFNGFKSHPLTFYIQSL